MNRIRPNQKPPIAPGVLYPDLSEGGKAAALLGFVEFAVVVIVV